MTTISVRYQETDQMGVAHHSVYPVWFEAGRTDLIREFGYSYGGLEAEGLYLPLIELACTYRSFAKYEDILFVKTWIDNVTYTRIKFAYAVIKEGKEGAKSAEIARGSTVHVFANAELKPVNLSKYRPEFLKALSKGAAE